MEQYTSPKEFKIAGIFLPLSNGCAEKDKGMRTIFFLLDNFL